ncbi:MAG: amino acid adenylation domain-containing protein [Candidatus Omnitrophota bacterium]
MFDYEIINRLNALNIQVQLIEGHLKISAPEGALTPALINELREKKEKIINFLKYAMENAGYTPIELAEKKEYYGLSSSQKRLFLLQQMEWESIAYNISEYIPLSKEIEIEKLKTVFRELIQRHESLRTSFHIIGEEPIQKVHDNVALDFENVDVTQVQSFVRPFDLAMAPLLRVGIVETEERERYLLVDMHHIISDGISQNILKADFAALYDGQELAPLRVQYKDFTEWLNCRIEKETRDAQELYWLSEFDEEIPVLNLPTDYPRPALRSFEGRFFNFDLDPELSDGLRSIGKMENATLFMVLLAVSNILLSKLSGQQDIIIGTPIAGRRHPDLEKIIGIFLNTLALRNYPIGETGFRDFLKELRQKTLKAFENQDYQFEDLVEKISIIRDPSRNPLFDVMLELQQNQGEDKTRKQETVREKKGISYESKTAKFDMVLHCEDRPTLFFAVEYSTRLFKAETIERFAGYFKQLISYLIQFPGAQLADIEILSDEEKNHLVYEFNETDAIYPTEKTIHELFEDQVIKGPDHLALIGSTIGDEDPYVYPQLSYRELNERSNRLAYELIRKGVKPDTIVAIKIERSIEMIMGILGILKAGGAYLPIDPDYPPQRVDYMLNDSSAQFLFLTAHTETGVIEVEKLRRLEGEKVFSLDLINLLPSHPLNFSSSATSVSSVRNHSSLAYIIYTSGSTGNPKGVLVEHRNVVRLMTNEKFQFDFNSWDVWTMFHSYCFDFSVWEMYGALLYGGKLVLIPSLIAKDPAEYLKVLKRQQVTVLNQTPAAFYNLAEKEVESIERELSIRYVVFGGEALNPAKLKDWKQKYPETTLINMFGITETTVHVTFKEIGASEINNGISNVGKPIPTLRVYMMDRWGKPVPIGVNGELVVGGEGVARGYLNRPELTAEKFVGCRLPVAGCPNNFLTKSFCGAFFKKRPIFYKSGDLGRYLSNGDIEYLGRIDQQVKVRGFRIELGEIENRLLSKPGIKDAVVLTRRDELGDNYLCAYLVLDRELAISEIREHLAKGLPGYMIPSYFVIMENIPLTSNGKVDRRALQTPVTEREEVYMGPRDDVEEKLAMVWAETLRLETVGIRDNYFTMGGDSMKAIKMLAMINNAFDSDLKIVDLFTNETIEALAVRLREERPVYRDPELEAAALEIEALKTKILGMSEYWTEGIDDIEDLYPMSDIEKGMVYHSLQEPDRAIYHDQIVEQVIYKDFDPIRFEKAVLLMADKHPILRTSFHIADFEEPVQVVHKRCRLDILFHDLTTMERSEQEQYIKDYLAEDRGMPFNFSVPPLWRLRIFTLDKDRLVVLWVCHHSIIDGWSDASFKTELNNIYLTLETTPDFIPEKLKSSYKDFMIEQRAYKKKAFIRDYWISELSDYKRLNFEIGKGKGVGLMKLYGADLGNELMSQLNRVAAHYHTRLKHLCFGAYLYMLNMLSYENDITVGLVTHNRPLCEDGDKILGCFLNTVPVRMKFPVKMRWSEYIRLVEEKITELFDYDRLSLFEIVELIGEGGFGQNPVFDTLFNYVDFHVYKDAIGQDIEAEERKGANTNSEPLPVSGQVSTNTLFDFNVNATLGGLHVSFTYSSCLFNEEAASRLFYYFKNILNKFVSEPEDFVSKNDLLTEEDTNRILDACNGPEAHYPSDTTIYQLFEEQVKKTPDHLAVVGSPAFSAETSHATSLQITYRELNERSDQLAYMLKEKGVKANTIVAVKMVRSIELIVVLLGILKSGGAYLPLNPRQSRAQTDYILMDSGASLLVTTNNEEVEKLRRSEGETVLFLDPLNPSSSQPLNCSLQPATSLAYVIYTSGSTGRPKGVLIGHSNISPLLHWGYKHLGLNSKDKVIQNLSYYFDWSVWEIFITLTTGASLYMIAEDIQLNPGKEVDFMIEKAITVLHVTPTQFGYLLNIGKKLECLNYLFIGAETLSADLVGRTMQYVNDDCRVFNMYGPTEATIISAVLEIKRDQVETYAELASMPIGKPTGNLRIYVLDNYLDLCPIGVTGQLHIDGDGVAWGYLNNPEMASEKFVHSNVSYERLYRTGDLGRWLPDGNLQFLGRIDHQVKIRGFRIELGEIENRLLNKDGIRDAVVLAHEDKDGDKFLCAYMVFEKKYGGSGIREYLAEELPDYMIPSHFVTLDQIPFTPNGKVDRKALPKPGLTSEDHYLAPQNELEEKLVVLFENVLHLKREFISTDRSFFELGGHSLKATMLVSKIQREIKVKIPLIELFRGSTVQSLAKFIETFGMETDMTTDEHPVLLKRYDEKTNNLFLIHDGTGEVEGYIEFCKHITIDFEIWGIRADRLDGLAPRLITIPELASAYIERMKKVQAEGPYYIAGWSLGGTIAFEIVTQLERMNETINFLALFDSPPPHESLWKDAIEFNLETEFNFIKTYINEPEIEKGLKASTGLKLFWSFILDYLEAGHYDMGMIKQVIAELGAQALPNFNELSIRESVYYMNMTRTLRNARAWYKPAVSIGTPVHYFAATESKGFQKEHWENYISGTIIYHEIEGDHFSIFRMPRVSDLASEFENITHR